MLKGKEEKAQRVKEVCDPSWHRNDHVWGQKNEKKGDWGLKRRKTGRARLQWVLSEVLGTTVLFSQGEAYPSTGHQNSASSMVCSPITMSGWSFLCFSSVSSEHKSLQRTSKGNSEEMPKLQPGKRGAGKQWKQWLTLFVRLQNHCRWQLQPRNEKMLAPWKKNHDQPRQHIKKHYFANQGPSSQSYGFSSSHVWMWELDYKESWALKNWCFWTAVLEETLESPLDCKEIQPVHPKGDQS